MKKLHYFLLIISFILCTSKSYASHIMGADISYKCIGGSKYEFTLTIYRDCDGIPVQPTYKLDYSSVSCNIQGNITMTQVSMKEISPICATDSSTCIGGEQPGIQQYIYKGTFTLPSQCSDWVFSWTTCARTNEITNINDPGNQCLHIEATLNSIIAPCNNAPTFNNPPVSFLCMGQENFLNPGTVEEDGDLLNFTAITPKTGKITTVNYKPTFSATNPVKSNTPFVINNAVGDIAINPATSSEVSVTAILVEEKRNGVVIGSVMRDMLFYTRNCNNNNPTLSNIASTGTDSIGICAGQQVCLTINGSDLDAAQNLTMTWNQPWDTAVAKFKVTGTKKKPKANICWKTSSGDAGLHIFTVTINDDFCPIFGSTTKAFKVRVYPLPKVLLPNDTVVACNSTVALSPKIAKGQAPFVYKWSTGEVSSFVNKGQGNFYVTVTDRHGCKGSDTISINGGIKPGFMNDSVCTGSMTHFIDTSRSIAGTVEKWNWNFGDPTSGTNNTSALQNPSHAFTKPGIYQVKLEITDNFGCSGSVTKPVRFCDIPNVDFNILDSCLSGIVLQDLTTIVRCNITKYYIQAGSGFALYDYTIPPYSPINPNGGWNTLTVIPSDTGKVILTLIAENENGCKATVSKNIRVLPKPSAKILENSYYFKCNQPDTTLHGVGSKGKPPYKYVWSTGETTPSIHINKPGDYSFSVIDANGCSETVDILVLDPIIADIKHQTFCEPTTPYQFIDNTDSHWAIAEWKYIYDDGTTFITNNPAQSNPTHLYPVATNTNYKASLIVTDITGCKDTADVDIVHKFPDNNFSVEPTPICLGQLLNIQSPSGNYIDSLSWDFGNGDTMTNNLKKLHQVITGVDTIYDYTGTYEFKSGAGSSYNVTMRMYYNKKECFRDYSKTIDLFPELKVDIDTIIGNCGDFPTEFRASQKNPGGPTNVVSSWQWYFYHQEQLPPYDVKKIDSSTLQNPVKTFKKNGNYYATLIAKNLDGCEVVIDKEPFSVVKLPTPYFCTQNNCASQKTVFFAFCNSWPEVVIDSVSWDFGDGGITNVREPFHIYSDSGHYNVKVGIYNTTFGCKADTLLPIKIFPLPTPDFTVGDVCMGDTTKFLDLSTPAKNEIISDWRWSFGDGSTSNTTSPEHKYSNAGNYDVQLVIESSVSGCTDTITKKTTVHTIPNAGFTSSENELVSGIPVVFTDQSSGAVKWLWNFGDGKSYNLTDLNNTLSHNATHTYDSSTHFVKIEQIVYSDFGCSDTTFLTVDLNVYYIVPNAFSPNGDGKNDGFFPTYKGIASIPEYKVYDRWGQLIYDGSENMRPSWDGKYQGVDQPVGVYVYYTRAIGFNQQEFVLSGKVTLIR